MKVLVVDDERAVRESLRRALELEGYDVELASDGESALARLDDGPPVDATVLDVLMPGIDGLEVCRRLRATANAVPVLMLTARSEVDSPFRTRAHRFQRRMVSSFPAGRISAARSNQPSASSKRTMSVCGGRPAASCALANRSRAMPT